jgi:hypothetical protein
VQSPSSNAADHLERKRLVRQAALAIDRATASNTLYSANYSLDEVSVTDEPVRRIYGTKDSISYDSRITDEKDDDLIESVEKDVDAVPLAYESTAHHHSVDRTSRDSFLEDEKKVYEEETAMMVGAAKEYSDNAMIALSRARSLIDEMVADSDIASAATAVNRMVSAEEVPSSKVDLTTGESVWKNLKEKGVLPPALQKKVKKEPSSPDVVRGGANEELRRRLSEARQRILEGNRIEYVRFSHDFPCLFLCNICSLIDRRKE